MKTFAVLLNPEKDGAVRLARELVPWLLEQGATIIAEQDAARSVGRPSLSRDEDILSEADFAIVLGGDGTLLRANRILSAACVPMIALRFGQFGFMTDIEPVDAIDVLGRVLAGDYRIDERMMLRASLHRGESVISTGNALNDIVIAKGPLSRMLRLGTHVSGEYVATYPADGLIVATPTGSTAYSLSAGGPVVSPELRVFIVTPICPHTLNARSLIVSSEQVVDIIVESDRGDVVFLTIDGQVGIPLEPGDRISVCKADVKARLVSVDGVSFFRKLRQRLKLGDRFDI